MATLHAFFGQSKKGASASASRSSLGVSPLQSPPARKAASSADTRESKRPRVNDVEPARRAPTPASAPVILGGNVFLHQSLKFLNEDLRDGQGRRVGTEGYDRTTLKVPTSIQGVAVDKGQWKSLFTDGGKQWWNIKKDNFDAVLLFKQGKFYEMFNMDAEVGVRELGLKWMGDPRQGGKAHAGFPEVSFQRYAQQLVDRNYRVIRIEQTETPEQMRERTGKSSGTLMREACQFLSAGTNFSPDDEMLKDHSPKCLVTLVEQCGADGALSYGVCVLDPSTSCFEVGSFVEDMYQTRLATLLSQLQPAEILFAANTLSIATKTVVERESAKALQTAQSDTNTWDAQRTLRELSSGYFQQHDSMEVCESDDGNQNWPPVLQQVATTFHDQDSTDAASGADLTLRAVGACVSYLKQQLVDREMVALKNFHAFVPYDNPSSGPTASRHITGHAEELHMVLDTNSIANLELLVSELGEKEGSLLGLLDRCHTPAGHRLLKNWLLSPLYQREAINARLDAVTELVDIRNIRDKAATTFAKLPDFERLLNRIHSTGRRSSEHPMNRAVIYEDLSKKRIAALRQVLDGLKCASGAVREILRAVKQQGFELRSTLLRRLLGVDEAGGSLDKPSESSFPDLTKTLEKFNSMFDLSDDMVRPRPGFDLAYDAALEEISEVQGRLAEELESVREEFGGDRAIKFFDGGAARYQVEIPAQLCSRVPSSYSLKSQVKAKKTACQRFHTRPVEALLEELEQAETIRDTTMKHMLQKVCQEICTEYDLFNCATSCIAQLDVLFSFSEIATDTAGGGQLTMCRPELLDPGHGDSAEESIFELSSAWHPILAKHVDSFIANDTVIGGGSKPSCLVLTGPNMGGKSTLLRQTAVVTIMAQLGCYVPAEKCRLTPVDRIFTRMGARDNIMMGQSTFMIEMHEAAIVLRHATRHSLVLMDELGRGTSTFDGVAIAYGVAHSLAREICCRTLFTTHYHTLMPDFSSDAAIGLAHMGCLADEAAGSEQEMDITFLYRLTDGPVDKSYGMHVAKRAGLSSELVRHAAAKSRELELTQQKAFARNLVGRACALVNQMSSDPAAGFRGQEELQQFLSAREQAKYTVATQ